MPNRVNDPEMLLWPRLSRFYGLSFGELRRMKRVFVRMYAEQMQIIRAEEMLDAITVSAYPYMTEADQKTEFRRHRAVLRAAVADVPKSDQSKVLANPDALTALGIAVVRKEPVKEAVDA